MIINFNPGAAIVSVGSAVGAMFLLAVAASGFITLLDFFPNWVGIVLPIAAIFAMIVCGIYVKLTAEPGTKCPSCGRPS